MLQLNYNENGLNTAQLNLRRNLLPRDGALDAATVSILPSFAEDRATVERFITDIYARAYGALIHVRYPVLMSVSDKSGRLLAATGFRPAGAEPLFLEQYLDAPIDEVLHTPRDQIAEIGNLASDGGGASLYLFTALAAYLNYRGYTQAVVTGTNVLERRFRLLGLDPKRHAKADPALLLCGNENWGTYYDTQPHVLSGTIDRSYRRLQDHLGAEYHDCRPRLFPRLHYRADGGDAC